MRIAFTRIPAPEIEEKDAVRNGRLRPTPPSVANTEVDSLPAQNPID